MSQSALKAVKAFHKLQWAMDRLNKVQATDTPFFSSIFSVCETLCYVIYIYPTLLCAYKWMVFMHPYKQIDSYTHTL